MTGPGPVQENIRESEYRPPQGPTESVRTCDMTEIADAIEGTRKVGLVSASVLDTVEASVPEMPKALKDMQIGVTFFNNIPFTINTFALFEWWSRGKKQSDQHTAFMLLSTIQQVVGTAKFAANVGVYITEQLGHTSLVDVAGICDKIGSIPVLGQGMGILETVAYSFSAWHHTNKIRKVSAKVNLHNTTIQKVQRQLVALTALPKELGSRESGSKDDAEHHAELQKRIEADRELSEEAEVTRHITDGKHKLEYLETKFKHRVELYTNKIERAELNKKKYWVSLVNDISHIVYGILTILSLAGVTALAGTGLPMIVLGLVAMSISLYKFVYHKRIEKQLEKKRPPPIPEVVKMAQEAARRNLQLRPILIV